MSFFIVYILFFNCLLFYSLFFLEILIGAFSQLAQIMPLISMLMSLRLLRPMIKSKFLKTLSGVFKPADCSFSLETLSSMGYKETTTVSFIHHPHWCFPMLPCLFLSSWSFSSGVAQVLVLVPPLMSLPSWNHSISYFKRHTYTNAGSFQIYISHTDFCFHFYTQMSNSGLMIYLFNKNFVSTWITDKLPKFNMSKTKYLIPSPSIPKQAPPMVA